ncbi:MAG: F390 synthetase-related protein [Saprospiraceae bacterium]
MKLLILWYYFQFWWQRKVVYSQQKLVNNRQKLLKKWRKGLSKSSFYQSYQNADLQRFPIISKKEFMENFDTINTVNISKKEALHIALKAEQTRDFAPMINGITIGLSSGTSGNKGIFLANKRERAKWVAAVLDRVIGLELRKRKVAFFLRANSNLYESVGSRLLKFQFFDIKSNMLKNIEQLVDYQSHILVAQPSVLREIAYYYYKNNISIFPEKVISVAEVLEPQDKRFFEQVFQQKIHQVYQCTEGFLAATCEEGNLHLNEDFLIIEKRYLDENQNRFHPIITDLNRESQPVIRYELNDILHEGKTCQCGRKTTTIEKIEGRSDDVFRFENGTYTATIFPDFIRRAVIMASDDITFYTVIQCSNEQIDCYLEIDSSNNRQLIENQVESNFEDLFENYQIKNIKINFLKNYQVKKGEKLRRIFVDFI